MADLGEQISLAFQFVASFSWAIGAGLAGPEDAADHLQFVAALAWCVANLASLWSMTTSTPALAPGAGAEGPKRAADQSSV